MGFKKALTATEAISKLAENDKTFTTCDLSNNAIVQMKGGELVPQIAAALRSNTSCTELNLTGCNVDDSMIESVAQALESNTVLSSLNLEGNRINNDGAVMIARSLKANRSVLLLNLLNQKGSRFGDATLGEFTQTLETHNVTLLKIVWRLESRQSFRLTKMLTRNNDIDRRIKTGKEYESLMPADALPFTPEMLAQRVATAGGGTGAAEEAAPRRGSAHVSSTTAKEAPLPVKPISQSAKEKPASGASEAARAVAEAKAAAQAKAAAEEEEARAAEAAAAEAAAAKAAAEAAEAEAEAAAAEAAAAEAAAKAAAEAAEAQKAEKAAAEAAKAAVAASTKQGPTLGEKLQTLAEEEAEALAKLNAEFAQRREAILAQHAARKKAGGGYAPNYPS